MSSQHRDIKLYATLPHSCSYLPGRDATTLFVDPEIEVDPVLYSQLSSLGFRRSGEHLYRPNCTQCQQCVATRLPVDSFVAKRRQRRIWQRNADIEVRPLNSSDNVDCYPLYERYITQRHRDGDMYPPSREQFDSFLSDEWGVTQRAGFFVGEQLLAVAVYDSLVDGLSAIYTFFEPEEASRSLGVYAILWQIQETRRLQLSYLYLGYWIRDCRKMQYKTEYRPIELRLNDRWVLMS